jgi:rhodanese-related sulfurtransferase
MYKNYLYFLTPREAYAKYLRGDSMFIDVREEDEPAAPTPDIHKMLHIPLSELYQRYRELPSNRSVVVVSRVGNRSQDAARFLSNHGFYKVGVVDGGIEAWQAEGFPVRES